MTVWHMNRDSSNHPHLAGMQRVAKERKPADQHASVPFMGFVCPRLSENPYQRAVTLCDEVIELDYDRPYPKFTARSPTVGRLRLP